MAYSELIKDFNRIRSYMRSFYVYGFRHRSDYHEKSPRGYDNERRRVESWLGEYMSFQQNSEGKRTFLSVDSRAIPMNPFYRAFQAKSFTDRDIMLHFHLLDILDGNELPITEIMDELADHLSEFESDDFPDESTVRKKLKEYEQLGLINRWKRGRETLYSKEKETINLESWEDAISFFAEAAPLGVIGSFLQQHFPDGISFFRFKHHYILNAIDSEILCKLFLAIGEKRTVTVKTKRQKAEVIPLKIYIGTQTGRQHLLAFSSWKQRFVFFRLDQIDSVTAGEKTEIPADLEKNLGQFQSHLWGVAGHETKALEHLEMTVYVGPMESFVVERLLREERCGNVERTDENHWRFSCEVYDALEMLPWVRTFTGRITDLQCSNKVVMERFCSDLREMAKEYGGKSDAFS